MRFYHMSSARPWGDYGKVLIGGICGTPAREGIKLRLERSGPFMPPITFPGIGEVVVTSDFRDALEQVGSHDLAFAPVIKAKIVELRWDEWDRAAAEPREYPQAGDPEDYIRARPHSPAVSDALGDLWEVLLPEDGDVRAVMLGRGAWEFRLDPSTWRGARFFRATGKRHIVATEDAKAWLEGRAGEWLTFVETVAP